MKFRNIGWFLFFGLLFIAVPVKSDTTEFIDIYRIFLENELPTSQQVKESFFNLRTTPFDRKELAFNLLVPKDWRDIPLKVSPELLEHDTENMVSLTIQLAPENEKGNGRIEVAYLHMQRELDLNDIVDFYLEANNLRVLMRRGGTYNQRKVDEALVYSKENSKSYIVRMTFSRHGDRIFLVSGSALQSEFPRYSHIFAAAAVSLTVQQKATSPYAEPMETYAAAGTQNLEFKYPKNWRLKEAWGLLSGKWGADISLPAQDKRGETDETAAFIHIKRIAQSTGEKPEKVFDNLKEDFENIPINFDRLTLEADLDRKLEAPLAKLKKWTTTLSESPAELSLLVWPQNSGYLALGLLTPPRQVSRYTWMHAWRVFEIITSDLINKQLPLIRIKNLNLPLKAELTKMATRTMSDFAQAVIKKDFSRFYSDLAPVFQASTTPQELMQSFGRFKEREELKHLEQYALSLDQPIRIDEEGFLALSGHFSSQPELTCFELNYKYAQEEWKLISIHVFLEDRGKK